MVDKIGTDEYGEILIYQTDDGQTNIEVKIEDDTVWLTQQQLTELYQCSKSNISEHIKHIFEEGELDKDSVVRKFRTTADDGKTYNVTYYNLDMIISLGYRIKSVIATRFRQWATQRLKEYMIKGFTIDDERLKGNGGGNYWKELLDRIRDIRSSEKVLYRQVLDLYATSVDYNPHSEESVRFFKIVQNKLHYAAHGHTAAEVIYQTDDGQTNIEVKIEDDTVWLTQQQMSELFQTSRTNVVEHIKHIYEERELDEISTCRNFRQVRKEGNREVTRQILHYNLDMIISLGYRIKSVIATRFRQWATQRLKEYMIKGFTIDDERLKGNGGGNYWIE